VEDSHCPLFQKEQEALKQKKAPGMDLPVNGGNALYSVHQLFMAVSLPVIDIE